MVVVGVDLEDQFSKVCGKMSRHVGELVVQQYGGSVRADGFGILWHTVSEPPADWHQQVEEKGKCTIEPSLRAMFGTGADPPGDLHYGVGGHCR